MNVLQMIDTKRRGEGHTEAEIRFLIERMMAGDIPDYQLAAWLMAVCIQGLSLDETAWLTDAYVQSGQVLDLSDVDGIVVDKHSTGGVGDKTTLVLIPLLAVSGVKVAKLSGRGLGFTGGTIDKLEAIPGFGVSLTNEQFIAQIRNIGVAISSQTADLAPADGKLYALRDVTCTVESIPLIAASVVSKKIAAGAQVIVLDIKYGRGAFMKTLEQARTLARTCREVGKRLGRNISTLISSMDQPLGHGIGHTLEVAESIQTLQGKGPKDLEILCLMLGTMALVEAGLCDSLEEARQRLKGHIEDGSALAKFRELVQAQGGNVRVFEEMNLMPQADQVIPLLAEQTGYVSAVDSLKIAQSAKLLGAGRERKEDLLDLGVGVVLRKKIGDAVAEGEPLAELHAGEKNLSEAMTLLKEAFTLSGQPVQAPPLIDEVSFSRPDITAPAC